MKETSAILRYILSIMGAKIYRYSEDRLSCTSRIPLIDADVTVTIDEDCEEIIMSSENGSDARFHRNDIERGIYQRDFLRFFMERIGNEIMLQDVSSSRMNELKNFIFNLNQWKFEQILLKAFVNGKV